VEIPPVLLPTFINLKWRREHTDPNDFVLLSPNGARINPASVRMTKLKPIGEALGIGWLSWQHLRRVHRRIAFDFIHTSDLPPRLSSESQDGWMRKDRRPCDYSGFESTEMLRPMGSFRVAPKVQECD